MQNGYLNLAYKMIFNYIPKSNNETILIERIISMIDIKNNGLNIETIEKKTIKEINILFAIHNSLPYDNAGYAIRTNMIATNLKLKGFDLVCATRAGYPWDLQKHKEKEKIYEDIVSGVTYRRLVDKEKLFKQDSDFNYIDNYANQLVKLAKEKNSTIIHGHSNYLNGWAAIQASNILKIPSIYEIRGLWHLTRLTLDSSYKNGGMFDYEVEMLKAGAISADAVVTISEALKILLLSWGIDENKIYLIPNAVDSKYFKIQKPNQKLIRKYDLEGKVVVGYIGSITGYEGLKELVLVVNELVQDNLNIVLIIVGEGREKLKLEKISKTNNIIFIGKIPFEEVSEYYSIFDICPFPRNNYEVCQYVPPLKILEAMAMKKAVIVSDVAPLVEIIEHNVNGLVCKADSIKSLKDALLKLYMEQEIREKLGSTAYKWVLENRTWDKMSEKYIELYNSFKA